MPLPQSFYNQPTQKVAEALLGKVLVRKIGSKTISGIITETEAYLGPHDKACHTAKGITPRNQVMFGPPGFWYIYLIYGMYHCLNVTSEEKGHGSAVLIRAIHPLQNINSKTDGPGKLCRAFKINQNFNQEKAFTPHSRLCVENPRHKFNLAPIQKSPRIGVDYAKPYWNKRLLRFYTTIT